MSMPPPGHPAHPGSEETWLRATGQLVLGGGRAAEPSAADRAAEAVRRRKLLELGPIESAAELSKYLDGTLDSEHSIRLVAVPGSTLAEAFQLTDAQLVTGALPEKKRRFRKSAPSAVTGFLLAERSDADPNHLSANHYQWIVQSDGTCFELEVRSGGWTQSMQVYVTGVAPPTHMYSPTVLAALNASIGTWSPWKDHWWNVH